MVILGLGEDKRHDLRAHFAAAADLARRISATFKHPIELEFEKCYYPYMLFSKKRYAGLMYTRPDEADYIDVKGLQLVRRDSPPIVREVSQTILDAIMRDKNVDAALAAARQAVTRVLSNQAPTRAFVVSKALRGGYKVDSQPHVHVARQLARRRGYPVPSGERVPYVFVNLPDTPLAERAEDPAYVAEHGLPLDLLYYVEHQLRTPIVALTELLVPNPVSAIFQHPDVAPLLEAARHTDAAATREAKRVKTNARNNQREITEFLFRPDV